MALDDDDEWMKPGLLEARGEENGHIQTSRQLLLQDLLWRTDLLTDLFEAGRRVTVCNVAGRQRLVDRLRDGGDPCGAAGLIAVEGGGCA